MKKVNFATAACVCLLPLAAYGAQKFDVKPGLSEVTSAGSQTQSCMTAKELGRGIDVHRNGACHVVSSTVTAMLQEVHLQCDAPEFNGTYDIKMSATDREHFEEDLKSEMVAGGQPMSMALHATAKWLKSDCGSVKPAGEQPKR